MTAAHPFAACFGCTYEFSYEIADLVEVWNGPWTTDDQQTLDHWDGLLRSGTWLPAIGDSDAHNPDQIVALPHTVVLSDSLRRKDLLAVGTGTPVTAQVTVGGVPGTTVSIMDQLGVEQSATVPASGQATVSWTTYPRYSSWLRVEVRRPSGGINTTVPNAMVALTNPIFLGNS